MIVNLIFGQSLIHSIGFKVPQVQAFLVCVLRWDSPLNRRYTVLSFYAFIFQIRLNPIMDQVLIMLQELNDNGRHNITFSLYLSLTFNIKCCS